MASTTSHHHRLLLPVVMAGFFMYGFDGNIANVAVPSLRSQLHAGPAALELIIAGYVFAYATGLITGGRLGDLFGHRRMFLAGMAGFTVASLLCALAQNPGQLIAARLLQGLTAAAMVPQVLALVTSTFPQPERARALSWYGVTGGLSGVCGQVLGGLLLAADVDGLGWRTVFLVNIPIGVIVLAVGLRALPRSQTVRAPGFDFIGVVGLSGSFALGLVPLVIGQNFGWPAWAWVMLVASVPALAVALAWERRLARRGGNPLLDVSLLRSPVFSLGLAVNAGFMLFFTSTVFVMSLLLQTGLGESPLRAGLSFTPMAALAMASSLGGRRLVARHGGLTVMTGGCVITGIGLALAAGALQWRGGQVGATELVLALGLVGLGNGFILPSLVGAPLSGVRPAQAGVASGMLATTQQFASVVGIATLGGVFLALVGHSQSRADFASAAEVTLWLAVAVVAGMLVVVRLLNRAIQRAASGAAVPAPAPAATAATTDSVPASA